MLPTEAGTIVPTSEYVTYSEVKEMKRGFTIVELLMAAVLALIVLSSIYALYITSVRTYGKVEKLSNVQEQARIALEQMDRLFDRWGVGVPYNNAQSATCSSYPPMEYPPRTASSLCYEITTDSVVFYASTFGMGLVKRIGTNAELISCRLNNSVTQNCYYVWRGENPVDNDNDPSNGFPFFGLSNLNPNNADCVNWTTGNATVSATLSSTNVQGFSVTLREGDIIMRVPHRIRIYRQGDILYVEMQDMSNCGGNELARPIAYNVSNFLVEDLTQNNERPVIRITLTLRDPQGGQEYTFQRIYGRW